MDLPDGRWGFWMGKCATISQPAEERLPYWCQEIDRKSEGGKLKYFFTIYLKWAIAFNIRTPGWGPIFSSYTSRLNKIAFILQDFIKMMGLPLKIVGATPGGGTWVFFGWVCAARDSKLAPRSKKISPKIDCPVLEMGQFFIPRSRIRTKTDTPF